jgi:7-cyano-7-deazaguanosine (preQ0) biosynthesis protein QueE
MLKVNEIFFSIQGEGGVIGLPSVFIRLAGCNLRCEFCDTKYALDEGKKMSEGEIIKNVWKNSGGIKRVTITGGEPLLQNITKLISMLKFRGFQVIIETNGTIIPDEKLCFRLNIGDLFVVSPKLSNSGCNIYNKCEHTCEKHNFNWADYLKFVICKPRHDILEIDWFLKSHFTPFKLHNLFHNGRIILQPNGLAKSPKKLLRRTAEYVKKHHLPYRVLPQLHRQLWGLKRGV